MEEILLRRTRAALRAVALTDQLEAARQRMAYELDRLAINRLVLAYRRECLLNERLANRQRGCYPRSGGARDASDHAAPPGNPRPGPTDPSRWPTLDTVTRRTRPTSTVER